MNRMQLRDFQCDEHTSAQPNLLNRFDIQPQSGIPAHRFFMPLHYETNYAYPLLIWLHGPNGSEKEIKQVMPHISVQNYVGVSPRGIVQDTVVTTAGAPTYTWDLTPQCIEYAVEHVLQCITSAKHKFNIAQDRVFLAGYDVGGTMALRLALSLPECFAGVISIGGRLPDSNRPLAGVQRARSLPLMIAHSRDSDVYPTHEVCNDLRLLHSAGMSVTLRQYPCEQEVTTQMLMDVNAWVMEQVSGIPGNSLVLDDPTHLRLEDCN